MIDRPNIDNAPGLVWRKRRGGEIAAVWQAQTECRKKGFEPTSCVLWSGAELPEPYAIAFIQDRCTTLQREMVVWMAGGIPRVTSYTGTLSALIDCFLTDPDSPIRKVRYRSRCNYENMCQRLITDHGDVVMADIRARDILRWNEEWTKVSGVSRAHSLVSMFRSLCAFGQTILEEQDAATGGHCIRVGGILSKMKFKMGGHRKEVITAEQAIAVRKMAHTMGWPSIALAQALQFDLMLRQRDVIGEWIPLAEKELSDRTYGQKKWLRGLRWEEVEGTILRHVTSKRQKEIEFDLRLAPMVLEELGDKWGTEGPIVLCEETGRPWDEYKFRRTWRRIAKAAGVPTNVQNRDSRAGGITEALGAGATLEETRHAATHSNISMTQRYSRESAERTAKVMQMRAAHRTKREDK